MQRYSWLVFAGVLCGVVPAAPAVTNIRFERWSVYSHVRPEKSPGPVWRSFLGVEFDATATAADLASGKGLRFAIAEHSPGGNQVLAHLDLAPCATLPAAGADVYISARIELVCGEFGRLKAVNCTGWTATWCDLPEQQVCTRDGLFPLPGLATTTAEPFEFVLRRCAPAIPQPAPHGLECRHWDAALAAERLLAETAGLESIQDLPPLDLGPVSSLLCLRAHRRLRLQGEMIKPTYVGSVLPCRAAGWLCVAN